MKLVLFGATGSIGTRILSEALARGHVLTAITRDWAQVSITDDKLTVVAGNALDPASVAELVTNHDAVLSAIGSAGGSPDPIVKAAHALTEGLARVAMRRLVIVGGAGTLDVAPDTMLLDTPHLPPAYLPLARAHLEALNIYKASDLDWSFVCPAGEIAPGERTGKFRVGADRLLVDVDGQSQISTEDYAIAFMDEVERAQYLHRRMTVAY